MMKPLKIGLRVWIAITSLLSFLGGWAIFSHSGKPAPLFSTSGAAVAAAAAVTTDGAVAPGVVAPLPTLPAIPSLNDLTASGSIQALPALPNLTVNNSANNSVNTFTPRLRTRGS